MLDFCTFIGLQPKKKKKKSSGFKQYGFVCARVCSYITTLVKTAR